MTDRDQHARRQDEVDQRTALNKQIAGKGSRPPPRKAELVADAIMAAHDHATGKMADHVAAGATKGQKGAVRIAKFSLKAPGRVQNLAELARSDDRMRTAVGIGGSWIGGKVGGAAGVAGGAYTAAPFPPAALVTVPAFGMAGEAGGAYVGKTGALKAYDKFAPQVAERAHEITDALRRKADELTGWRRRFPAEMTKAFNRGLAPPRSTGESRQRNR